MKNLPLVANKQGICSRNINIHVIWVWAENTVNSGVLLHLHHQTLQFFGEPPVPTVKCYSNFCTKICVVLPLSLHWTYDISEIHGFRWCSTQVSPDSPGCVRNPKSHTLGPPQKNVGCEKMELSFSVVVKQKQTCLCWLSYIRIPKQTKHHRQYVIVFCWDFRPQGRWFGNWKFRDLAQWNLDGHFAYCKLVYQWGLVFLLLYGR